MQNSTHSRTEKRRPLWDMLRGTAIGCAFIIPGFSSGSVAAILGIYERLVGAIADLFSDFRRSVRTLIPIGIGMVVGILALLYPLEWALSSFPIPTVCLFLGLALGGIPSVTDKLTGKPKIKDAFCFLLPLLFAIGLAFLPLGREVDLFAIGPFGFLLLFLVGVAGASALVIPGISGSMVLLILGYYNPIIRMITGYLFRGEALLRCILTLGTVALGIATGFFLISYVMKRLLAAHPRSTYFAILGFILGSAPALFSSVARECELTVETALPTPLYTVASVLLLLLGAAVSFTLYHFSKTSKQDEYTEILL